MLRKTPWKRSSAPQNLKLRLSAQATLIALSALFISACSTPQGPSTTGQHKIQSAHSNDIWQRIRDNFAMPELENQEVYSRENYYATRADYVGRMATRSGDFLYLIMDEVERRHMPSELALLPFVESAFVTTARSPVSASGLWQFMPATGRDFSLQQNRFADQRNDVMASTNAALDYLQRLYDRFGDWHLALAAYNWGQGNVNRAVNRSVAAGGSGKYTEINMPAETRQYVPKLQAIKNIVRNPTQYGISLPNIPNRLRHEAVLVSRDIDVSKAAELANLSEDEFKRLNPAYKRPVIVAALNSKILVPADRADDFRRAFSDKHRQLASLTTYTTYSTEALTDIASKYNTDENRLRELNDIPYSHSYVRADSTLIVPRTRATDEISYLALNSSVRSITGDVGITDYNSYSTPTLVADAGKSTSITAPGRSSTGLVADTSDADQLGTLINNTPSTPNVPTYVPTVASTITPSNAAASAPVIRRDTIAEPRIETPATTTIATAQTNPSRATDILSMPPVAKPSNDPIAQLTAGNTSISNDNTTETSQLTAQATDTGNNTQAVERIAENNDVIIEPTATQIADATGTTNASHVASASNTPATPTLSTAEKIVVATVVSAAVSTANEPNRAVVKTNYRVPQTPQVSQAPVKPTPAKAPALVKTPAASQNKAAVANTKPSAQPAKASTAASKPALKATNKPAEKVSSKASTKSAPVKPEPKKVESKPALKAPPPNTAKTKVANTQQTNQKPATAGKMPSKVELKKAEVKPKTASASKVEPKKATEVSKAPAKITPTAATKTAVKGGNTSSVKPAVVTPKKK